MIDTEPHWTQSVQVNVYQISKTGLIKSKVDGIGNVLDPVSTDVIGHQQSTEFQNPNPEH